LKFLHTFLASKGRHLVNSDYTYTDKLTESTSFKNSI